MNTSAWAPFRCVLNQASPCSAEVIGFTDITANSVFGVGGSFFGHCTSPIFRAASGGIETVMSDRDGLGALSPPNNVAWLSVARRLVATSISTLEATGD